MDNKQALIILLHNSKLIKEEGKNKLISRIHTMSPEEIETLGKLFSYEMAVNIELDPDFLKNAVQE